MSATVDRVTRLDALIAARDLDLLIVSAPVNLRWVTGFTGSNGAAVVGGGTRTFATDFRYLTQSAEQVPDFEREIVGADLVAGVAATLPTDAPVRLGFEDAHVTVSARERLGEEVPGNVELVAAGTLVEELRAIKDESEVVRIRAATALADEALDRVLGRGLVGRTERDVALDLEFEQRRLGAEAVSFAPIVASAAHGALPHAEPRDVEIEAGTLVVIDWGAQLDGYCSDCTRTFATGELDPRDRKIYELVLQAQEAALAAVRGGITGTAVDAVARDLINAAGHEEHFGHGLGHGVGLEVHESPRLSVTSEDTLAAGQVVTVEPGIYVPGAVGVRIEDLVVVTADGCEILTPRSKALTVVS